MVGSQAGAPRPDCPQRPTRRRSTPCAGAVLVLLTGTAALSAEARPARTLPAMLLPPVIRSGCCPAAGLGAASDGYRLGAGPGGGDRGGGRGRVCQRAEASRNGCIDVSVQPDRRLGARPVRRRRPRTVHRARRPGTANCLPPGARPGVPESRAAGAAARAACGGFSLHAEGPLSICPAGMSIAGLVDMAVRTRSKANLCSTRPAGRPSRSRRGPVSHENKEMHACRSASWLNSGDTSWQITAATLVGLMSVPGLVVLYGGVMQKRWSINSMMLTFAAFAVVLVIWVLYAFKMGFGSPFHGLSRHGGSSGTSSVSRDRSQPHRAAGPGQHPAASGVWRSRSPRWSTSSSCSPRSRRS